MPEPQGSAAHTNPAGPFHKEQFLTSVFTGSSGLVTEPCRERSDAGCQPGLLRGRCCREKHCLDLFVCQMHMDCLIGEAVGGRPPRLFQPALTAAAVCPWS